MGCWNGTCAVTNLPIWAGDPIRLILTLQQSDKQGDGAGFCYSDDYWAPVALPVKGTYNDYGGIEDIKEDWNTQIILDHFTKNFEGGKVIITEDKYDGGADKDIKTLGDIHVFINDYVERDLAYMHSPAIAKIFPEHNSQIGFIMVHEGVYQAMLKYDYKDTWKWKSNAAMATAMQDDALSLLTKGREQVARHKKGVEALKVAKTEQEKLAAQALLELSATMEMLGGGVHHDNIFFHTFCYDKPIRWVLKALWNLDPKHDEEICKAIIEFHLFRWSMSGGRRDWNPKAGKGSQADCLATHEAVLKAGLAEIKRMKKERAKYV
jgi:hypothetical protein